MPKKGGFYKRFDFKPIPVAPWGADKVLRLEIPVQDPPPLTQSKKCFKLAHLVGKLQDITVTTDDGVTREVRVFCYIYAKPTKEEIRAWHKAESEARANEPTLV